MVKIYFSVLVLSLLSSSLAFSNPIEFKRSEIKPKEEYSFSKCVDGPTNYAEKLTYDEICKYSASCPSKKFKGKVLMYCTHNNLSECFEGKSWKTEAELVGLPNNIEIGLLTHGLSFKRGAKSGKTCVYYD